MGIMPWHDVARLQVTPRLTDVSQSRCARRIVKYKFSVNSPLAPHLTVSVPEFSVACNRSITGSLHLPVTL